MTKVASLTTRPPATIGPKSEITTTETLDAIHMVNYAASNRGQCFISLMCGGPGDSNSSEAVTVDGGAWGHSGHERGTFAIEFHQDAGWRNIFKFTVFIDEDCDQLLGGVEAFLGTGAVCAVRMDVGGNVQTANLVPGNNDDTVALTWDTADTGVGETDVEIDIQGNASNPTGNYLIMLWLEEDSFTALPDPP